MRAAERSLQWEASASAIAAEMRMGKHGWRRIQEWAAVYREHRIEGFHLKKGISSYTAEEKEQAVEEYLKGRGSLSKICRMHHIPSDRMLKKRITVFNSNNRSRELRDYNPRPEVYAAMRKKTTKEERQEIVRYCLEHGKDQKGTVVKHEISYS